MSENCLLAAAAVLMLWDSGCIRLADQAGEPAERVLRDAWRVTMIRRVSRTIRYRTSSLVINEGA